MNSSYALGILPRRAGALSLLLVFAGPAWPTALDAAPMSTEAFLRLSIEAPREAIERGATLAESPWARAHPIYRREILVRCGWAAQLLGDVELLETQAARLEAFAAELGDEAAAAHAVFVRAALRAETGSASEAIEMTTAAATRLVATGTAEARAIASAGLCDIGTRAGRFDLAARYCPAALTQWQAIGDPFQIGRIQNYLSMLARDEGRADDAITFVEQAQRNFRALDIPALEKAMGDNLSGLLLDRESPGDAERALALSSSSLTHELAAGKRQFAVVSRLNVARAHSALGHHDQALAQIAQAIREAESIPYEVALPELYVTQLGIAQAAGHWELVGGSARGAIEAASRIQDREREELLAEMEGRYRALEKQREIDRLEQEGRLRALELDAAQGSLRRQRLLLGTAAVAGVSLTAATALLVLLLRAGRRREQELDEISRTDALTGAASRRSFLAALDATYATWQRDQRPATLVLLDADEFKSVNDRYGHPAGDRALVALVERVRAHVREGDLVGRIGGEEFGIVLPGLGLDEAVQRAEAVRLEVAATPLQFHGHDIALTASLGLAVLEEAGGFASAERWLSAADAALYEAKRTGRNRLCVASPRAPGSETDAKV